MRVRVALLLMLSLTTGCAGMAPAQLGQTAGTIVGSAIAPGIGAPLGALMGMLAGLLVQNEVDKVTEKTERKTLGEQLAQRTPSPGTAEAGPPLSTPTRIWVDETVKEGRLLAGHFDVRYVP